MTARTRPLCVRFPAEDAASSTAEVQAIDAAFTALANGLVFPLQLDFSTSRAASHYQRRNIPHPDCPKLRPQQPLV